ncbi:B3/B4 domain-containing protein (DNA/RNA-binding domain of Phe-tRNA-synthetase) [Polaromonas sp. YR568]|uniref:B3/B4 domain-containing protein n=1 Tax=Polaromonas sp. YR568 TaxID=1855301 RepID=UPI0008E08E55|nr:phenylalanine--tRNA ligase beta subunit-related protein [Polaromonas sp. YR568]SFU70251.1 B3/B4 domain-containing protein (DNA/RNA-binding domain of Phe-tRNA-synthetase) [Polaromonas sp. YR568]
MFFRHSEALWADYPELVPGVLYAGGITPNADVGPQVVRFNAIAQARLATGPEGEFAEVQAWRRTFSKMGLKPTQYRCASESLLRRFRKEGSLPQLHPLVDLCNAISLAFAIPIAVFDVAKVSQHLEVRYATGAENYLTFGGDVEHPEMGEVIFADATQPAANAHARRWTNRQSGLSAVSPDTRDVLIVAEALHTSAGDDVARLVSTLVHELTAVWPTEPKTQLLSRSSPHFEF